MGGKAFGAGAELAVDGGPEILEGGEEVNQRILKNPGPRRKNFDPQMAGGKRDKWKRKF